MHSKPTRNKKNAQKLSMLWPIGNGPKLERLKVTTSRPVRAYKISSEAKWRLEPTSLSDKLLSKPKFHEWGSLRRSVGPT